MNTFRGLCPLVGPSGLEPPTSCLSGTRSNLLSYEPMWLVCFYSHPGIFQDLGTALPFPILCQHWAIFPCSFPQSIFATAELNFCVRNGNRWTLCVYNTDYPQRSLDLWKLNNISFARGLTLSFDPRQSSFVLSWTTQYHLSVYCTFSIERRWSSRTFRYGYLVTT